MSYALTPYLIDLEELRRAVGSRRQSLIAASLGGDPNELRDAWETEEDAEVEGLVSFDQAVRHLVMGEPLNQDCGSEYGYALERLCRHLGEVILPDAWGAVRWAAVTDSGLEDLLTKTGSPVPIPNTDFPVIGHWTAAEVAAKVSELGGSHLTSDDDELQELLEEYEGWLRKAAAKGNAIVFFYY
jgi:hypothetical protein